MQDYVGKILKSRNYGNFQVLSYKKPYFHIRFIDTGFKTKAQHKELLNGSVKDWERPHVYGKGFRGKGEYSATYIDDKGRKSNTTSYEVWRGMLRRCYDTKYKRYPSYGGRGVVVCDLWLNYQNFASWYEEAELSKKSKKLAVDKDLTILGNKVYSPDNCELIPYEINSLFVGGLNNGVYFKTDSKKFRVQLHKGGNVQCFIGDYESECEAKNVYRRKKQEWVTNVANNCRYEISDTIYKNLVSGEALEYYLNK